MSITIVAGVKQFGLLCLLEGTISFGAGRTGIVSALVTGIDIGIASEHSSGSSPSRRSHQGDCHGQGGKTRDGGWSGHGSICCRRTDLARKVDSREWWFCASFPINCEDSIATARLDVS